MSQKELERLNRLRENNEYYLKLFHKLEEYKSIYLKNNLHILEKIILNIYKNDNYLITKIDKRKVKHLFKEQNIYEIFKSGNYETIVNTFFFTASILKSSNDLPLISLSIFQNFFLTQLIYMNYPYIHNEIGKIIRKNPIYSNYYNDIENKTIEIIINAIVKFDTTKNIKFVTYLSYWIKHGIKEEVTKIVKEFKLKNFDNIPLNYRFVLSDFIDAKYKSKHYKDKLELKEKIKLSCLNRFKNLCNDNFNLFSIVGIEKPVKVIECIEMVDKLNKIINNYKKRKEALLLFKKTYPLTYYDAIKKSSNEREIVYNLIIAISKGEKTINNSSSIDSFNDYYVYSDKEIYGSLFDKLYKIIKSPEDLYHLKMFETDPDYKLPPYLKEKIKEILKNE